MCGLAEAVSREPCPEPLAEPLSSSPAAGLLIGLRKTAMAHHHEIAQLLLESGAVWASGLNVPWFLAGAGLGAPAAVGAVSTGNSKLLSLVSGEVRCSCLRSTRVRRKQQITRRLFSLAPKIHDARVIDRRQHACVCGTLCVPAVSTDAEASALGEVGCPCRVLGR